MVLRSCAHGERSRGRHPAHARRTARTLGRTAFTSDGHYGYLTLEPLLDEGGVVVDTREYWLVNRVTSNAIVMHTRTHEVIAEIPFVGKTPDIVAISPASATTPSSLCAAPTR